MTKGKTQKQSGNTYLPREELSREHRPFLPKSGAEVELLRRLAFFRQARERIESEGKQIHQEDQEKVKRELAEVRQEIQNLAKKVVKVGDDIDRALQQPVVSASRYEISFWGKIRQKLANLARNVDDVALWLKAWSHRRRKKGDFWGIVSNKKKGGAQFLLSAEHYPARAGA